MSLTVCFCRSRLEEIHMGRSRSVRVTLAGSKKQHSHNEPYVS